MNSVLSQNERVLEEELEACNLVVVKTTLRDLRNFQMTLLLLQVIEKPLVMHCHFVTCIKRVLQMAQ